MGRLRSHRPAKAGVEFAGGVESVGGLCRAARAWCVMINVSTNVPPKTKRLLSTPCCRSTAVEGAVVSEEAPQAGRAAMGAVFGVGAADRTARLRKHRPSGRERSEAASSQAPYPSQRRKCRRSLIALLVLFPREPLRLRSRGSPVCLAKRECAVHGGREKRWAGLMESSSNAPQKRGLNSPRIWRVSVVCAARRASGRCCGPQQPTNALRRKGFYHPLAAADWQLKEQ